MATLERTTRNAFCRDLVAAQTAIQAGVVAQRSASDDRSWEIWSGFCDELAINPTLAGTIDPVPYLQVFAHRYRTGALAPHGRPVRARTVEGALRAVGQTASCLGPRDPRFTVQGKTDFRLQRQLKAYGKADPPPSRTKPLPVSVLRHALSAAHNAASPKAMAVADMACIAFFFLMRPGEYASSPTDSQPFRIADVQLFLGSRRLDYNTSPPADLHAATFVSFTFTTQKNGVRGEVVGLGCSGDPLLCPVRAAARQLLQAKLAQAPADSPICGYPASGAWRLVRPTDITTALRVAVVAVGPALLGFTPADISARSLRASGAMALLCSRVDTDIIRLVGRWRSDEMLRYLHVQAQPVMRDFSRRMITDGDFGALLAPQPLP